MPRRYLWTVLLVAATSFSTAVAAKDPQEEKREQQAEQKAAQELKHAQDKLEAAKKTLAAAINAGKQVESSRDAAHAKLRELKERNATKYLDQSGLASARQRQATARQELEQALATFKASAEYKAAFDAAAVARRQFSTGDNSPATQQQLKELIQKPAALELAAIAADPHASAIKSKLSKADSEIAAAQKKLDELLATDPELAKLHKELEKANGRLDDAKRTVTNAQRDAAAAFQKVTQEAAQRSKVQAANRQDDIKDKQRSTNKNNKKK